MLFEAKLGKADAFKKLIDSVKELVQEAVLECLINGIEMQAMDSSHVSLVVLLIKKQAFVNYRHSRDISLGVNLVSLSKILKCAQVNDSITLKVDNDCESMEFVFESPDGERISEFSLKLMDLNMDNLGIPDTDYDCNVRIPSAEFNKICQQLGVIGNTVTITVTKESIQFNCCGDMGKGKILLNQTINKPRIEDNVSVDVVNPVTMVFALRFLHMFSKASSLSNRVRLSIAKDVPALIEYEMNELNGHLRFYLAPKIDDD